MEIIDDRYEETTGMGWRLEVTRERATGDVRGVLAGLPCMLRAWIQVSDTSSSRVQCIISWSLRGADARIEVSAYGPTAHAAFTAARMAATDVRLGAPPLHEMQALAAMMEAQVHAESEDGGSSVGEESER